MGLLGQFLWVKVLDCKISEEKYYGDEKITCLSPSVDAKDYSVKCISIAIQEFLFVFSVVFMISLFSDPMLFWSAWSAAN